MPGPHPGEGSIDAADKWLTIRDGVAGETVTAAALATMIAVAKIRMLSFILVNPLMNINPYQSLQALQGAKHR